MVNLNQNRSAQILIIYLHPVYFNCVLHWFTVNSDRFNAKFDRFTVSRLFDIYVRCYLYFSYRVCFPEFLPWYMYCIWSRQQTRVFVYLVSVFTQVWRVYCGLWHYFSAMWKEPVHSHRKRECGNFVYSFWSLYWSCIKPFESEVFCTFQFHAVLGKNCQNNRLSPLLGLTTSRLGNQESSTAFASFGRNISYRSLTPSKDQLKRDVRN